MGLIRFLLAMAVVFSHLNIENIFTGGGIAVQSFYIISGFFVALIFDTVSSYQNPLKFYGNRVLRLFPIYYVVLIFSFILLVLFGNFHFSNFFAEFRKLDTLTSVVLLFSNLLIFGQDLVMFLGWENNELKFVTHFSQSAPPLYNFLLVPQAWSLGIELSFYLIAPYLMKLKTRTIFLLIVLGLFVRILFYKYDLYNDPWSYRFFGLEVFTFLIGSLAYRMYKIYQSRNFWFLSSKVIGFSSVSLLALFALGLKSLPVPVKATAPVFYIFLFFLLPIIFNYTKNMKYDRHLGDLSYPIYMVHIFSINIFSHLFLSITSPYKNLYYSFLVVASSIVISVLLNKFIQHPIDNFRNIKFKGGA